MIVYNQNKHPGTALEVASTWTTINEYKAFKRALLKNKKAVNPPKAIPV